MLPVLFEDEISNILYHAVERERDIIIEIESRKEYPIIAEMHRHLVDYDGIKDYETYFLMDDRHACMNNIIMAIYIALNEGRNVWINDADITGME